MFYETNRMQATKITPWQQQNGTVCCCMMLFAASAL